MQVIRHQDVRWTEETFTGGGVQKQLPEMCVKTVVQPARGAWFQRNSPQDSGETSIMFWSKPRQMVPIRLWSERRRSHNFSVAADWRPPQTEKGRIRFLGGPDFFKI